MDFKTITIVGPGLLGGSLGLGLKLRGYEGRIIGVARQTTTLETAKARGCIDEAADDLRAAVADAQLIVLATPVRSACRLLESMAGSVGKRAVITDVGSTKQSIVATANRVLDDAGRFVGSHPMAGAETSGPGAARADLYIGKPVIITPTDATHPPALRAVESLWRTLGMSVHRMTPSQHDRAVAAISHLPHALSALLMRFATASGALGVASTGLADMTRLAGGDVEMWADIFSDNRQATLDALDHFQDEVAAFRAMLADGDREQMADWLTAARNERGKWNRLSLGDNG